VEAGALVRSSYHAGRMHRAAVLKQRGQLPARARDSGGDQEGGDGRQGITS
jgi:hypothetical protein